MDLHRLFTLLLATVWLINGLFCKVFNLVPRHEQIVAMILGDGYSREITLLIGIGEVGIALWIVSGLFRRACSLFQILMVAAMNALEFFIVPDLLLWGGFNAVFAGVFILIVYLNGFILSKKFSVKN